jgi:hypothetical protein
MLKRRTDFGVPEAESSAHPVARISICFPFFDETKRVLMAKIGQAASAGREYKFMQSVWRVISFHVTPNATTPTADPKSSGKS